MFKRILVPLDGSARAELALPLAVHLARAYQSTIILMRSIELMSTYAVQTVGISEIEMAENVQSRRKEEAERYLNRLKDSPMLAQVPTITRIGVGNAAVEVLDISKAESADLIVLCSHGYTGLKQWALGSTALGILRMSTAPVLIQRDEYPLRFVSPTGKTENSDQQPADFHICVALDGSPQAEEILEPARAVAMACAQPHHRAIDLVRVVQPLTHVDREVFQEVYQINIDDVITEPAQKYLQQVVTRLKEDPTRDPEVTFASEVILSPDIAQSLIQLVEGKPNEQAPYQLLAMTTHGRNALNRWIFGSVAERVLSRTRLPLLILRPEQVSKPAGAQH